MTQTQSHAIRLLNKSYNIKCSKEQVADLQWAANHLNDLLVEKKRQHKHLDEFHLMLLSALHISHELITSQTEQAQQRQHLTQFIQSLESKLSQTTEHA